MGRFRIFSWVLAVLVGLVGLEGLVGLAGCTAISGADGLRIVGGAGEASDAAVEGRAPDVDGSRGSDGGEPSEDGSPGVDANAPDTSNVIYATGFSSDGDCAAWSTAGTVRYDESGHGAPGSCRLCAPAGGDVDLTHDITAPRSGRVTFEAWLRSRQFGTADRGTVGIRSEGSNAFNTFSVIDSWDSHSHYKLPITSGRRMTLVVGLREAGAGDCIIVDDVAVTIE